MRLRAVALLLVLPACRTSARQDVPAVLSDPTAASRAELQRAVSGMLKAPSVTFADDALTRDGTLIVDRAPARGPDGLPLQGRETGRPEHFRLVRNGSRCVLVHEGSGLRQALADATCRPL